MLHTSATTDSVQLAYVTQSRFSVHPTISVKNRPVLSKHFQACVWWRANIICEDQFGRHSLATVPSTVSNTCLEKTFPQKYLKQILFSNKKY